MLQLALGFWPRPLCGGAQCRQPSANGLLFLIGRNRPLRQATPLLLQGWFWSGRGLLFFWLRVLQLSGLVSHLL